MRYRQTTFILLLILSNPFVTAADKSKSVDEFALCKPFIEITQPRPVLPPLANDSIRLFADSTVVQEKLGTSTCSGNVLVQRDDRILNASLVIYDIKKNAINVDDEFVFWDKNFVISGDKIQLDSENHGEMNNAKYWFLNQRIRGFANKLLKQSDDIINLEQAHLTTCDPEDEVWRLDARSLTLDNTTEEGTARDVTIRLLDTPVFYTPYLSFPLGERKSGLLAPNLGTSDKTGVEFSIPYFFNLAPNYDWTITPRVMSRRGFLVQNEFRYLTQSSDGNLKLEYMPYDSVLEKSLTSLTFRHNGKITERLFTDININDVSDGRYFEELGNNISTASLTHLERRGDLYYYGNNWLGIGRLQMFQTLAAEASARPYQRLPQFLFKTALPEKNGQFNWALEAELVRFDRNSNITTGPTGNRIDMKPIFSFPWRTPGTFVIPQLSLRYTHYNLNNVNPGEDTAPNRFLFTFSTDSGLFLERDINLLNTELVQTLEPRLFYRHTPYKDQNDIPIFDTGIYDLSFGQLFRDNNFSSADRVDDAHQISLGMSSRLLGSDTGIEYLRASAGQAFYFRDRRVALLPQLETETTSSSLIVTELSSELIKNWRVSSTFRWDPHINNTEHTVLRMRYRPDEERIFNLSYRLRDEPFGQKKLGLEQTDLSFHWSLTPRWNILGRWNFSLPDQKTMEVFSGLEYSSCCWAVRFIARHYLESNHNKHDGNNNNNTINNNTISDNDFDYSTGVFLQFQLKGLGGVGRKADSFLEERIPGYYDQF
ncbi:LPS assembly protein LptD [Candidatus Parabeggiatoa sp. HSG14]|uniref:LPS-assembly protein LptD n=1 Tax=Candidatus Parabeggiatoa sp. HSG14 TaxID=3055593 RepID=UPI0025A6BE37|nr:LPS assembly protein LptD [Thiotrichales bacterium HSG14]